MSSAPEAIMSRALNVEVLDMSFVANLAFVKHSHEEVFAEARKASGQMVNRLKGIIARVA